MNLLILNHIIIILALVLVAAVLFRALHLPVVLGYLIVGALLGPHALGVIKDINMMESLAGFGVVFLMFTVGLEFSLSKLIALRRAVFLLGGLQVLISMVLAFTVARMMGMLWHTSLVIAGVIAMSSTAIVTKQLTERLEMNSRYGLNAVGILLFQDLAVIPLLIMISSPLHQHIASVLGWALLKGIIAISLIIAIGHFLMQRIFRLTAATRVMELFTLLVLLVAIASAWLTNALGMSFALGAFLAGIMLAETKYHNQIEIEIRPFRDILMGMFFVAIGMLVNFGTWGQLWPWILLLFIAIVIGKSILITLLGKLFGDDLATSARCGIILAQGGEFGFALLTLAFQKQLLSATDAQTFLGALILSIAAAPIIIDYNRQIITWILPRALLTTHKKRQQKLETDTEELHDHVIICGYGHVGQNVGQMLHQEKIPYFALDLDPRLIQNASLAGGHIGYGDSTHPSILKSAGLHRARILVICLNDLRSSSKIVQNVRHAQLTIPIIVRCKNDIELAKLQQLGATKAVAESQEESLMMTFQLLLALKMSAKEATQFIKNVRQKHSDWLEEVFLSSVPQEGEAIDFMTTKQLRPIVIPEQAFAVYQQLGQLKLNRLGVRVVAIRRGNNYHEHPDKHMKIHANDILILYGTEEKLDDAEQFLLTG
jgi:CPA2 family monovalent cation:H+ antiporter-2